MHKRVFAAIAFGTVLLSGTMSFGQMGGGGGAHGSGDSGGEQPFGNNPFREDEQRQQLEPEGASEYTVGLQLLLKHQYQQANEHLTAALASKPSDEQLLFYLGYSHHMLGQAASGAARDGEYKLSLDFYRRALALKPADKLAHRYLGTLLLQMHDQVGAKAELETLVALCPSGCDERDALALAVGKYQAALDGSPPAQK